MAELSRTRLFSRTLFFSLLFLFFALSSAEMLYVIVGIFKPKIGHLIALLIFGWMILEQRVLKLPKPLIQAFLLILWSQIISAILSDAPLRSFGYIGVYCFNFLVYFWIPYQVVQLMDLKQFFKIYWSSFLFVGIYATLQVLFSIFGWIDPLATQRVGPIARGQAWTYEPSYYALYMIPYVMYHNGKAFFQKTKRFKLFCQNMMIVLSTSTGLIVSYPAFYICYLMNPYRREMQQKLKKALLAFVIVLGAMTVFFYEITLHSLFKFFYIGFGIHGSFVERWEGIVASVQIFLKHPLFGVGLGGISRERYVEASAYDVKMITLQEFESFDPANCLTEVMASLGSVGLLTFVYLGIVFYRAFQEVIRDHLIDKESKQQAVALFISLVVMMIALQMNQGLFRPYVWIHAAVVYGFLSKVRAESLSKLHHVDRLF